jgi:hypothetical protein
VVPQCLGRGDILGQEVRRILARNSDRMENQYLLQGALADDPVSTKGQSPHLVECHVRAMPRNKEEVLEVSDQLTARQGSAFQDTQTP